jgi:excisionase family DNA binding protein
MTPREPLLTATEIAYEFQVNAETVRRWVREGRLAAITLPGGHKRFRVADIDAILNGEQASDTAPASAA